MTHATTKLGGTASDVVVGKVAHGLMLMTWTPNPVPEAQCFEAIKAGVDALPPGVRMFINGGEFYGRDFTTTNLELIARFFEKYPDYADKTFLSIKGGCLAGKATPDGSPGNMARSVNLVNEKLRGTKRLDLFQCARVDPNVAVEVSIAALAELKKEGKLDHIGMSECNAETLRRGHKVHPISIVEIEISPFSYEPQTREVIATAKELGVAVAAYAPLGRGFLTGQITRLEEIPEGDIRRYMPRFQPENFNANLVIVDRFKELAEKKDITPAQLSIGWVASLGVHVIPVPGSSHAKRTLENSAAGDVEFTEAELKEITELIESADVKGGRYPESHAKLVWA